jgi:hypothetical protein
MKPAPWIRYTIICMFSVFLACRADVAQAIDPVYDIDLKQLRPGGGKPQVSDRTPGSAKQRLPSAGAAATASPARKKSAAPSALKKRTPGRRVTAASGKGKARHRSVRAVKTARHGTRKGMRRHARRRHPVEASLSGSRSLSLSFRMPAPTRVDRGERLLQARNVWEKMVPGETVKDDGLALRDRAFSLSLDPAFYPVFHDSEGGRIVVDSTGALSPQVKSIIEQNDSTVHIVTADPADPRRFYAALLGSARFYSVEEGFRLSFGSDPVVTVNADFKVEKKDDSLLMHDIVLLNVSDHLMGLPPALCSLLDQEGFKVIDAVPTDPGRPMKRVNRLYSVTGTDQRQTVDSLLTAASVEFEKDRDIELDDGSKSGVVLSVRADRYIRENGNRVVVSFSQEDPVRHALLQLLQQRGYRVVSILPSDNLRVISGKIATVLNKPARYGSHDLWNPKNAPFAMKMSGVEIAAAGRKGGAVFVTDVGIDPLTRDLLGFMGYDVLGR